MVSSLFFCLFSVILLRLVPAVRAANADQWRTRSIYQCVFTHQGRVPLALTPAPLGLKNHSRPLCPPSGCRYHCVRSSPADMVRWNVEHHPREPRLCPGPGLHCQCVSQPFPLPPQLKFGIQSGLAPSARTTRAPARPTATRTTATGLRTTPS